MQPLNNVQLSLIASAYRPLQNAFQASDDDDDDDDGETPHVLLVRDDWDHKHLR